MKIIFPCLFALLSSSAFALTPQSPAFGNPGLNVYYASWCERNVLVFDPNLGSRRPDSVNCIQHSKVCVQRERRVSANQILVHAACEYGTSPWGR